MKYVDLINWIVAFNRKCPEVQPKSERADARLMMMKVKLSAATLTDMVNFSTP